MVAEPDRARQHRDDLAGWVVLDTRRVGDEEYRGWWYGHAHGWGRTFGASPASGVDPSAAVYPTRRAAEAAYREHIGPITDNPRQRQRGQAVRLREAVDSHGWAD